MQAGQGGHFDTMANLTLVFNFLLFLIDFREALRLEGNIFDNRRAADNVGDEISR